MSRPAKSAESLPGPTVFVVDDDASMREAISSLIRSVGLRVELFASAKDFLRQKRSDGPACLVLDVRLPGLSGLELQRELAAANNAVPIVFITGHGDIPMSVRAMKAGAVDFLPKPFEDQTFLDAVHQAVARDRQARQQRAVHSLIMTGPFPLALDAGFHFGKAKESILHDPLSGYIRDGSGTRVQASPAASS